MSDEAKRILAAVEAFETRFNIEVARASKDLSDKEQDLLAWTLREILMREAMEERAVPSWELPAHAAHARTLVLASRPGHHGLMKIMAAADLASLPPASPWLM